MCLDLLGFEQQGGAKSDLQRERPTHDRHVKYAQTRPHERISGWSSVSIVYGRRRQAIGKAAEERIRGGGEI